MDKRNDKRLTEYLLEVLAGAGEFALIFGLFNYWKNVFDFLNLPDFCNFFLLLWLFPCVLQAALSLNPTGDKMAWLVARYAVLFSAQLSSNFVDTSAAAILEFSRGQADGMVRLTVSTQRFTEVDQLAAAARLTAQTTFPPIAPPGAFPTRTFSQSPSLLL